MGMMEYSLSEWVFFNLKQLVKDATEPMVNNLVGFDIQPVRELVVENKQEFDSFVSNNQITWLRNYDFLVATYVDTIRDRYESEPVGSLGTRFPYLGTGTLEESVNNYKILVTISEVLGIIILVLLIAAIVLAFAAAAGATLGGAIPAILAALPVLYKILSAIKLILAAFGVILALFIWAAGAILVSPATEREQDEIFTTLQIILPASSGQTFDQFTAEVNLKDNLVTNTIKLHNSSKEVANPLVQTYIYSADGHIVEILTNTPFLKADEITTLKNEIWLQPGKYRVVSLIHTKEKIGLAKSNVCNVEIKSADILLNSGLVDSQLEEGQLLQANITITNVSSSPSDLVLLAWIQEEGQEPKTWNFTLDVGESSSFLYDGVPTQPGAGTLNIAISDGWSNVSDQSLPFVVGDGSSVALNLNPEAIYQPITDIHVPIYLINAGTQSIQTTVSLSTFLKEEPDIKIYSQDYIVDLAADTQQIVNSTWLANPSPERYFTVLSMDGVEVGSFSYAVEATDTYFVLSYPDQVTHNINDIVTLYFDIVDSSVSYVDVPITATVILPNGEIQNLELTDVGVGRYQSIYTPDQAGTYQVNAQITAPEMRVVYDNSYFYSNEMTQLIENHSGTLVLNTLSTLSINITTEQGSPVEGAIVTLQGTNQTITSATNQVGLADISITPDLDETYTLSVSKIGFTKW